VTDQPEPKGGEPEPIEQDDSPIRSLEEDRLGRRPFAEALAAEIMTVPAGRGYVMGVTGPWGSGKTSILNMTADALDEEALVVQFNPWMFSGTEALVASFFEEIGKQLEQRESKLRGIGDKLAAYGHLLSPLASLVGASTAVSSAADMLERLSAGPSVFEQREELRGILKDLDRRLVVIVDDVDRLRPPEVLDIVRLVRLVGDFPNTLYLLAFDRGRVEECLGEGNIERGRSYLEKIVQVTHDVPAAREPDVTTIFVSGLHQLLDTLPTGPLDAGDWQNVFAFVVRPLLVTPRSVRRLLGSLSMTMRLVGDEVALADLIGIEAVRVLCPAMFAAIVSVSDSLSAPVVPSQTGYQHGQSVDNSPIAPMVEVDQALAIEVCRWLFPAARRYFENVHHGSEWEGMWRSQRKISSASVFRFYLERQLPNGVVPARTVDQVIASLTDSETLQDLLDTLTPEELMDLVERMNTTLESLPFEPDKLDEDPARVALPYLLDLLPRLPEDTGMLSFSGSMVLMRAALRLFKRIPTEETRAEAIRLVLSETRSLSARLILLRIAGHREGIGADLVSADLAKELEEQLRGDLVRLPATDFATETRTVRLADFMAETAEGSAALLALAEDNRVLLSLFVGSVGQTRARAMGAAAVEVTKVLAWDQLTGFFDDDLLKRRTAELLAASTEDELQLSAEELEAIGLAADYATGYRPESSVDRIIRIQQQIESTHATNDGAAEPSVAEAFDPEGKSHDGENGGGAVRETT
jgi:hypothetical protein